MEDGGLAWVGQAARVQRFRFRVGGLRRLDVGGVRVAMEWCRVGVFMLSDDLVEGVLTAWVAGLLGGGEAVICVSCFRLFCRSC